MHNTLTHRTDRTSTGHRLFGDTPVSMIGQIPTFRIFLVNTNFNTCLARGTTGHFFFFTVFFLFRSAGLLLNRRTYSGVYTSHRFLLRFCLGVYLFIAQVWDCSTAVLRGRNCIFFFFFCQTPSFRLKIGVAHKYSASSESSCKWCRSIPQPKQKTDFLRR